MTKMEKLVRRLNDEFRDHLAEAFLTKFGERVQSEWVGFFSPDGGRLVTTRVDARDFTPEQLDWIAAYSDGYAKALTLVRQTVT
jgi:hypothetical protein